VNDPLPGGILVLEGWAPDPFLAKAMEEFKRGKYDGLYITGGPIETGGMLVEYKNYADMTAARLLKMGFDASLLHPVPAMKVPRDRTYTSAMALRDWLAGHNVRATNITLMTGGAHARRSRLLFRQVFGSSAKVGAIAIPDDDFDPAHWWRTSQGFRTVTGEMIAWFYARFLFHRAALQ
jgi:uncharacterized SAM-binding protein YcdF (DUF218 family)